jgi:hypothetical protein
MDAGMPMLAAIIDADAQLWNMHILWVRGR